MRGSTAYVFFENLICQFTDKFLSLSFFGQASTLLVILSKAKNLKSRHYVKDDSSRITVGLPSSDKTHKKNRGMFLMEIPRFNLSCRRLSTQAELSYDSTVAVDVTLLEIVKE